MDSMKKKSIDLGNDSVSKIFSNYAITSIIAMLVQSTAGLVDSVFIGRYVGPDGLSAITLLMPFIMFLGGIGTMVAIGGTTLSGIHKGKDEVETSNNYFNVTLSLLVIGSLAATILFAFLGHKLPELLGTEGRVATLMIDYIKILSLFFLPFLLTFALSYFLKLDGKPVVVVCVLLSGTVINIFLDYLLVGVLKLNMIGAALATGVSQLLPCISALYIIKVKSSWKFKRPIYRKKEISSMLLNGSSELMSVAAGAIAGFMYNAIIIDKIGVQGVSAYAVALQITTIGTSVFYGFAECVQSAVSFNLGANKLYRVKKFRNKSICANLVAGMTLCLVSLLFGKSLASIFVKDQFTIEMAVQILRFYAFSFVLSGANITLATYYTSVNSPVLSAVLSVLRSFVALVIGLIVLPIVFGNQGIWMAVIFAEIVTMIVAIVFARKYPFGSRQ